MTIFLGAPFLCLTVYIADERKDAKRVGDKYKVRSPISSKQDVIDRDKPKFTIRTFQCETELCSLFKYCVLHIIQYLLWCTTYTLSHVQNVSDSIL